MYGDVNSKFNFSIGWLEWFKERHGIKSYRRFGKSVDHSLATKQLEGRKKDKERLTVVVCCNGDGANKVPLWVITVKIYYRRPFYSSILEGYEKGEINPEKINVLDAIRDIINFAWNIYVKPTTIANCF
ncbi:hypothetical protein Godav_010042 [Gossypium davidsonii]|uniref:HTH CENPB-type domain-containing protein n=1 Tax=Gossypium davidsonii TaxID=34287 RepID=A0A7J8SF76_GOSDV|nr:hypothetical protein [Gossypium davidsonii]